MLDVSDARRLASGGFPTTGAQARPRTSGRRAGRAGGVTSFLRRTCGGGRSRCLPSYNGGTRTTVGAPESQQPWSRPEPPSAGLTLLIALLSLLLPLAALGRG